MALLARLAASGLRHASVATEGVSSLSLLARSSTPALQQIPGWAFTASSQQPTMGWSQQCTLSPPNTLQPHFSLLQQQQLQQLGLSSGSSSSSVRGISSSAAQNSQCDCPTLGGPTPDIVNVEYDEDEVDRFIALADAIEEAFPNVVVEGNPTGPGRPGSFEVTLPDGGVLYSKLNSGSWPEAGVVVDAIGSSSACGLPQE